MKRFSKAIAAIILMTVVVFTACRPEEEPNNNGNDNDGGTNENVTVITITPQDITSTSAVCGGTVTMSEGMTLSEVGVCLSTSSTPTVAGSHVSAGGVEVQFACTVCGLSPDTKYYICAYALCGEKYYYGNVKDFTTENSGGGGGGNGTYNGHDYVDLGLPSGTLWATCNVGASSPEGYGDYFAWGETQPKSVYNMDTYRYGYYDSVGNLKITKYNTHSYFGAVDNLTILQPGDDAATANWGGGARMPTYNEWIELCEHCTSTWLTMGGVDGRCFTGTNGNSLFLPATGIRWDGELDLVGSYGNYWSSSLYADFPGYACFFGFSSGGYSVDYSGRGNGRSVRAVRSAK